MKLREILSEILTEQSGCDFKKFADEVDKYDDSNTFVLYDTIFKKFSQDLPENVSISHHGQKIDEIINKDIENYTFINNEFVSKLDYSNSESLIIDMGNNVYLIYTCQYIIDKGLGDIFESISED